MYVNRRNFRVLKEIGVEEHDGDVRFFTGNGNMAISRMRNASGHNYWNTSFIVDVAMGQIPRSTERISISYHASVDILCSKVIVMGNSEISCVFNFAILLKS